MNNTLDCKLCWQLYDAYPHQRARGRPVIHCFDHFALPSRNTQVIAQAALVTAAMLSYTYPIASHYSYPIGGLWPGADLVHMFSSRDFA